MKRKVKQVVTTSMLGVVTATTVLNPVASIYAEGVQSPDVVEEPQESVSPTETASPSVAPTYEPTTNELTPENSTSPTVENPENSEPAEQSEPPEETNIPEKVYTIADINISATTEGYSSIKDNVLSYITGTTSGISLSATVSDGTQISSMSLVLSDSTVVDVVDNKILFSALEGKSLVNASLDITLENEQVVSVPMSLVSSSLSDVVNFSAREMTLSDVTCMFSLSKSGIAKAGNTLYLSEQGIHEGICADYTSLVEGVDIDNIGLNYRTSTTETQISDVNVKGTLSLEPINLAECSDFQVVYNLSNGQTLYSEVGSTIGDVIPIDACQGITSIQVDTTEPKVALVADTTESKEYEGINYIIKDGDLTFMATKDNELVPSITSVTIDGKTPVEYTTNEDGSVTINTKQFASISELSLQIDAIDPIGISTKYKTNLNILREAPTISGVSHSSVVSKNGSSYSTKDLDLYIGGYDNSKIASVSLVKDGAVVSVFQGGKASITSGGTYSIMVTDIVGNATEYKLSDLYQDLSNSIIMDTTAPTATIKVNNKEVSDAWLTGSAIVSIDVADDTDLGTVVVNVNGKETEYQMQGKLSDTISIDLEKDVAKPTNGIYDISVKCKDYAGNEGNTVSKTIKADFDAPTKGSLFANGSIIEYLGNVYLQGSISLTGSASDVGSGIAKIQLLKGNEVVAENSDIVISDEGEYTIRVLDNAGLYTDYKLSELLGTSSNSILVDNESPVVERVAGFTPDKEKDSIKWYKDCPTFTYNITDKYIKSVSIKVNGEEKVSSVSSDGQYTISTGAYLGNVDMVVTVQDCFGHISKDSYSYVVDTNAPVVSSASLSEKFVERGGTAFFKNTPTLTVSASDNNGIGVSSYILSGSKSETNTTGTFVLGSGSYGIEVKDELGNTTGVKSIEDLVDGLSTSDIVVDSDAPTIIASLPNTGVNNWYNTDVKFNSTLKDNQGIKEANVYVNGTLTKTYVSDNNNVTETKIEVDTSSVAADENGMYQISISVEDNAGNTNSWGSSYYEDKEAPTVNKFIFTGDGYQEGKTSNGSDSYGFYFKGSATCDIYVSDGTISSGMNRVIVYLDSSDGTSTKKEVAIVGGIASITLPNDFKGFISAYAEDSVGNVGNVNKPDGVVTESTNCFINNLNLAINLPTTDYTDISGLPLYSMDVSATAEIACTFAGIRQVEWGIGENTLGTVNVDNNGNLSGDTASIKQSGKNLVLSLSKSLALQGNANGLSVWVKVLDKTGQTSQTEKSFSIDKDSPKVEVAWDNTEADGYYNKTRIATVSVDERNFDISQVNISGNSGTLGSWSNNGTKWVNTITFADDGEYNFSIDCIDRAGNKSNTYSSNLFTIDKTNPVMSVSWDNNNASNGNYFNSARTATVTVVDKNFDSSLYSLTGNGSLGSWSTSGDTHTASISFKEDGEYEFSLSGQDLAGNTSESFSSGKFILDSTSPTLEITGVQDSVSYKGDVGLSVKLSDSYIDTTKTSVTLKGRKNGNLRVTGSFNETTGEFTFADFPKEETYDDIYTLDATITDKAGNVTSKTITFSVNRFGSVYTFLDSSMLGNYLNKSKDIVIKETNVDKLDTEKARVSVILDGKEVDVPKDDITIKEEGGETGKYSYTYTVSKDAFSTDGKYLVQIYSHAVEGTDYSSVSEEYAFVLDTTKPEVIISGISNNGKYHEYSKKVTIDVRDLSGVGEISATLNGKNIQMSKSNGVYSFDIQENASKQNLVVTVTDLAGNTTEQNVSDFVITSNAWVFLVNQLWFKFGIGAIIAFLCAMIALIIKSRKASRKEEDALLQQHAELYQESVSSTSGGLSTANGEKDLAEDLDASENEEK